MDYFLENNHCLQLFMTVTICTDVIPEKKTFLFISSFMELCTHPIAPLLNTEKYLPLLFSPLSPSLFVGEFKTGRIPVRVSNYLCVWANSRRGEIVRKRRRAKITRGKYNPVYSIGLGVMV